MDTQQTTATVMPKIAARRSDIAFTFGPQSGRIFLERDIAALVDRRQRFDDELIVATREWVWYREQIPCALGAHTWEGNPSTLSQSL